MSMRKHGFPEIDPKGLKREDFGMPIIEPPRGHVPREVFPGIEITRPERGKVAPEDVFPSAVPKHYAEPVVPVKPKWDDRQDEVPLKGGNTQNAAPTDTEAFPEPGQVEH